MAIRVYNIFNGSRNRVLNNIFVGLIAVIQHEKQELITANGGYSGSSKTTIYRMYIHILKKAPYINPTVRQSKVNNLYSSFIQSPRAIRKPFEKLINQYTIPPCFRE